MKLPRPLLLAALAVLAYFKIGNAKRRLGAYRRKKKSSFVARPSQASGDGDSHPASEAS